MQVQVLFPDWSGHSTFIGTESKEGMGGEKSVNRKLCLFVLALGIIQIVSLSIFGKQKPANFGAFFKAHCFECHGVDEQEGEVRLDNLPFHLKDHENIELWQMVLDQLNLNEMPPQKKPRPDEEETREVINFLTDRLSDAYENSKSTNRQTVLRRLNRYELRNTLRDLLFLKGADFEPGARAAKLVDNNGNGSVERTGTDPLRFFPEDEKDEGFVNIGDHLVMSDFLLKLTMDAVEESLLRATHLGPRPLVKEQRFSGVFIKGKGQGEHPVETVSREGETDHEKLVVGYERYGRLVPTDLRRGVVHGARYRITIEASAHNAMHPWEEKIPLYNEQGFELALNIANTSSGGIAGPTSRNLAVWPLAGNGKRHKFSMEVWLDKGWTPWIGWENGPDSKLLRVDQLVEKYFPDQYFKRPDKKADKNGHEQWYLNLAKLLIKGGYAGPHLRIHTLVLEPLIESWPPASHVNLYGIGKGGTEEVHKLVKRFASRAFRRPVSQKEIEPFLTLVRSGELKPTHSPGEGIQEMKYNVFEGEWSKLPDFENLKPVKQGEAKLGLIDLSHSPKREKFGMVYSGKIEAPMDGEYLFKMASDDGARILVDQKRVLEHDGLHGAVLKEAKIKLKKGVHSIRVEYFAFGQPNSFRASWGLRGQAQVRLSKFAFEEKAKKNIQNGLPPLIRSLMDAYSAILCSPKFLYLEEDGNQLTHHQIASRLSYFLWSSMPDDELISLAEKGQLRNQGVLERQVERMLTDERAMAFVNHFPSAWLRMDKLGEMPPSGGDFQFYKNVKIEPMMSRQVTRYFEDILRTNSSIEEFISSEYTYMNQPLAKWIYKKEGIRGHVLRKVSAEPNRGGGIFTLPGLMTATANGVDTSPVVRGAWVLENILGTPPSPPPPDVEPLPTDTRKAKTIRDQLELHREHAACNNCHRKIDPLGFPFENFDVVGRWRNQYKASRAKVDPSAVLSNGEEINDIIGLKKLLMEKKELVVRSLTEKMLIYATGRKLEVLDRGEVDRIVAELSENENRLRKLVHLVATSELFLTK